MITQNIDRLHHKAGAERVIEVHGSIETSSCTTCGTSYGRESVEALFDEDGVATCGCCMGKVKPDVVLFGEFLPEEPMAEAQELCERCDLLICVGSSLEVYPVAGLPSVALNRGARLAIVTQGPTPYDRDATVKLDGDVVEELERGPGGALASAPVAHAVRRRRRSTRSQTAERLGHLGARARPRARRGAPRSRPRR